MPLFGYTLLPPSPTASLWAVRTATPLVALGSGLSSSSVALYLRISGPACYETPVGSLVCLGQVANLLDVPVEQVVVAVQLIARDGTPLAAQDTVVARWVIPAGEKGPYRVVFETIPDGYAGAFPFVKSGQIAVNPGRLYGSLALQQVSGAFVLDQYQITLSVFNKNSLPVENVIVTMTLLDGQDQVTGFRQIYLDAYHPLAPGESLALTIKVIPQGPDTVHFEAFAEGYLVEN